LVIKTSANPASRSSRSPPTAPSANFDSVWVPQVDPIDDDGSIRIDEGKPLRRGRRFHENAPSWRLIRASGEMRSTRPIGIPIEHHVADDQDPVGDPITRSRRNEAPFAARPDSCAVTTLSAALQGRDKEIRVCGQVWSAQSSPCKACTRIELPHRLPDRRFTVTVHALDAP
jgi:hypothetical protein